MNDISIERERLESTSAPFLLNDQLAPKSAEQQENKETFEKISVHVIHATPASSENGSCDCARSTSSNSASIADGPTFSVSRAAFYQDDEHVYEEIDFDRDGKSEPIYLSLSTVSQRTTVESIENFSKRSTGLRTISDATDGTRQRSHRTTADISEDDLSDLYRMIRGRRHSCRLRKRILLAVVGGLILFCGCVLTVVLLLELLDKVDENKTTLLTTAPTTDVTTHSRLYAIGGWSNKYITETVEAYDFSAATWSSVSEMATVRAAAAASSLGGRMYVVGGDTSDGAQSLGAEVYYPYRDKWSTLASMNVKRSAPAASTFDGKVYLIGGQIWHTDDLASSVEIFDPQSEKWTLSEPMIFGRFRHASGVLSGSLYAIGGFGGFFNVDEKTTSTAEKYDPLIKNWTMIKGMRKRRMGLSVAVVGDSLYAIGGYDEQKKVLSSVERYNATSDEWIDVAPMLVPRWCAGAASHGGLLYVVGGSSSTCDHDECKQVNGTIELDTMEVYNPMTNTWTMSAARMSIGRRWLAVAIL